VTNQLRNSSQIPRQFFMGFSAKGRLIVLAFVGIASPQWRTYRNEGHDRRQALGRAARLQETRDIGERVLRRPHQGRFAVLVLR
jgi:hypothetical protein